ncbi:hypothetical protein KYT24_004378 [Salmonella enterica]|nr:hypothetical protein [Salmonella enterica]
MTYKTTRFDHLKDVYSGTYSPLLLGACINGDDFNDAIKILKHHGSKTPRRAATDLEDYGEEQIRYYFLNAWGEYLGFCGGEQSRADLLDRMSRAIHELMNRNEARLKRIAEERQP